MSYLREDFEPVPGVEDAFYCPACNRTPDDAALLPCGECDGGGVCGRFGTGRGSLTAAGVESYLESRLREAAR